MRHGKKFNHLGRTAAHRGAMLSNMASSLILYKRISTTVAKAKALRKYVEPLLTKSKLDNTHSRRTVFSYLQNKDSIKILFDEIAEKIADRPGGYTRILKTGTRTGDNAEMCIIELVDYNEALLKDTSTKTKTRRSRRGGKPKSEATPKPVASTPAKEEVKEESKSEEAKQQKAALADDEPKEAKTEPTEAKSESTEEATEEKAESKEANPDENKGETNETKDSTDKEDDSTKK